MYNEPGQEKKPGNSPQNPYRSYLVSASAGSGKTYQLSRRFLSLVAAGADPGSILTVTFTIKAATEMRTRILEEAGRLCTDESLASEFSAQVRAFYQESLRYDEYQGKRHPPPLSARETGEKILAAAQSLKITTIDAIFLEWVARFPYEAGADPTGNQTIPAPFNLANRLEEELFRNMAWKALCRHLANIITPPDADAERSSSGIMTREEILAELELERLAGLKKLVQELHAMDTYLWHEEMLTGSALIGLDEPEGGAGNADELLDAVAPAIRSLTAVISNKGKQAAIMEALAQRSLSGLQEAGLLTKQMRLNGQTVSKKVRDTCPLDASLIDEELRLYADKEKIRRLNRRGALSYRFFQLYRFFYNQLRFARGSAEFADLVKGSYALFHSAGSLGVKFILTRTIHHLMLDEFQDTSVLQWSVFREVADHLLAGDSLDLPPGPMPSLFVVGDEKQSIYGFREADPEVMEFVRDAYREQLQIAPLNDSYRTAGIVLSFVNQIFASLIPEFPPHQTAHLGGKPVVPDHGVVAVLKTLPAKASDKTPPPDEEGAAAAPLSSPAEDEARAIAGLLKQVLTEPWRYPVYDKKRDRWRPIKPDDCAVLYRSGTHAGAYDAALRRLDIPCQRDEEKGFFQRPEIADVLALLTYLSSPADLVALLTVCKSPIGAVPDDVTFRALAACKSYPVRTGEFLSQLKRERPDLVLALSELAHASARIPPYELMMRAYQRLDLLHAYGRTHGQSANEAHLATINLIALIERSLHAESQGISGLFELCRYFARMSVIDEVGNAATATGAVTLMTIHKSKGLEYPLVILADSGRAFAKTEQYWTQVRLHQEEEGRRADKVTFSGTSSERPEASALGGWLEEAGERTAQEAHRLLYVALTRAQHYVFVTGHAPHQQGGLAGTTYHSELQEACAHLAQSSQYEATEELIGGFSYDVVRSKFASDLVAPDEQTLPASDPSPAPVRWEPQPFTEGTKPLKRELAITSPSKHDLDEGPQETAQVFDWQDLLSRDALPPDMAAAVGTVVHQGIEAMVKGLAFSLKDAMTAAEVIDKKSKKACTSLYEKAAKSEAFKKLLQSGRVRTEVPLAYLDEDDKSGSATLVRGSADLVIEREDEIIVVDHKSTRFALPSIGADLFSRSLLEEFIRARGYDRQLALYARALEKIIQRGRSKSAQERTPKPVRAVIWFIDTDHLHWL